jgi:Domain of unknown function (DUF5658)
MIRACMAASLSLLLVAAPVVAADDDVPLTGNVVSLPLPTRAVSRGSTLPALYGALAGLQAYDGWSSVTALRLGGREANPIMAPVASQPGAVWAIKAGATIGAIYAAERLWKGHRHAEAIATMIAVNGIMASVAIHNRSILGALK